MQPLTVQAALLRAQAPDLVLRPGMALAARVLERAGGHGVILLAGVPLAAELPEAIAAGDRLRLRVAEVSAERVVLRLVDQPPAGLAPAPGTQLPLPDGRAAGVAVEEREGSGQGGGREAVTLRYDSPHLGPLGLRLELDAGAVSATVAAAAGEPAELARAAAEELRAALAEATGRPASVRIVERRDPVDVYA
jgi:Flagellar hook-length control protein FliK